MAVLKVKCNHPVTIENHGAGVRYCCPNCDRYTSSPGSRIGGVTWNHQPPPLDRKCPRALLVTICPPTKCGEKSRVFIVDDQNRLVDPTDAGFGAGFGYFAALFNMDRYGYFTDDQLAKFDRRLKDSGRLLSD
jgi:hypothetical protein